MGLDGRIHCIKFEYKYSIQRYYHDEQFEPCWHFDAVYFEVLNQPKTKEYRKETKQTLIQIAVCLCIHRIWFFFKLELVTEIELTELWLIFWHYFMFAEDNCSDWMHAEMQEIVNECQ